ncbi:MAG: hypothetical protein WC044_03665 [Crocinitomicaceae bacterium]
MDTIKSEVIENHFASLYVDADGVLVSKVKKDICTLEELDENYIHLKTIAKGNHVCGFMDGAQLRNFDKDDVAYMEREFPKIYKALAITTNSRLAKIKAFFAFRILQTKIPVRIFSNPTDAKAWLKAFL